VTEIAQVIEGRKYFRRVPHVGQPCSKSTLFCSPQYTHVLWLYLVNRGKMVICGRWLFPIGFDHDNTWRRGVNSLPVSGVI